MTDASHLIDALKRIKRELTIPAAQYVPAIPAVWDIIDAALSRHQAPVSTAEGVGGDRWTELEQRAKAANDLVPYTGDVWFREQDLARSGSAGMEPADAAFIAAANPAAVLELIAAARANETVMLAAHDALEEAREYLRQLGEAPPDLMQHINSALYAVRGRAELANREQPGIAAGDDQSLPPPPATGEGS